MIRCSLFLVLFAVSIGDAQVAPKPATQPPADKTAPQPSTAKPSNPPPAPDPADSVPATEPIITVKGLCSAAPAKSAAPASAARDCTTTVTKAQFEKLLNALKTASQTIPPNMRRNLAQSYVELMAYAQAAEKAGIDKDSKFIEIMRLERMKVLADLYRRDVDEKYRTPPEADVLAYYNQNLPRYEEIKLSRIFIPAKNPSAQNKDDWEKKAAQVATDLHDRAARGEDLEKLQKEAYATLGLTISPPSTTLGSRRRGMLTPADEKELFALKPSEVSSVKQEPAGYIIYKVESKETLPLDQVKDEISRELFRQKFDAQMKAVTESVKAEFNDQYFGSAVPPSGAAMGASPNAPATVPGAASRPPGGAAQPPPRTPPQ